MIVLEIHLADYNPLSGTTHISLPKNIATKKAVINVKNEDDQCFMWSVTRALNPVDKNAGLITKELKDQSKELNWSGLDFPIDLSQIEKFEKNNPKISVNVFGFEEDVYPLRISETEGENIANLLLISDGEQKHYCVIKNISRLLSSQVSKHKESKVFCLSCLSHFPNEEKLSIHKEYSRNNEPIKIEMSKTGSFIEFKFYYRSAKVPFIVYADFRSIYGSIHRANQMMLRGLQQNIRNINQVDFAI